MSWILWIPAVILTAVAVAAFYRRGQRDLEAKREADFWRGGDR